MRNIRDAGGALGPVCGERPELHNLTCSMTIVEQGDIVFLTTDGISDNFDPVVCKIASAKNEQVDQELEYRLHLSPKKTASSSERKTSKGESRKNGQMSKLKLKSSGKKDDSKTFKKKASCKINNKEDKTNTRPSIRRSFSLSERLSRSLSKDKLILYDVPDVQAHQRHDLTLLLMQHVIRGHGSSDVTASELCQRLVDHATEVTSERRMLLQNSAFYQQENADLSQRDQRIKRQRVGAKLMEKSGKLDHATVAAYKVGPPNQLWKALKRKLSGENVPKSSKKKESKKLRTFFRPHSVACDAPMLYEQRTDTYEIVDSPVTPGFDAIKLSENLTIVNEQVDHCESTIIENMEGEKNFTELPQQQGKVLCTSEPFSDDKLSKELSNHEQEIEQLKCGSQHIQPVHEQTTEQICVLDQKLKDTQIEESETESDEQNHGILEQIEEEQAVVMQYDESTSSTSSDSYEKQQATVTSSDQSSDGQNNQETLPGAEVPVGKYQDNLNHLTDNQNEPQQPDCNPEVPAIEIITPHAFNISHSECAASNTASNDCSASNGILLTAEKDSAELISCGAEGHGSSMENMQLITLSPCDKTDSNVSDVSTSSSSECLSKSTDENDRKCANVFHETSI